ncbi:MAG TPA: flavin-dependent oxidoreductase [Polyangiales bacterium]|nr:flavin-dependent oxidoreductase [Polyangiales bacterium]
MTHVLIVGGGIGGLTAALSLAELGYEIDVFESTPEVRPLGVGINVLPHAVRELHELGLAQELEHAGVLTSELAYFSKHGQAIWSEPRGIGAGYRWPQISIHRGVLHLLLLAAARERLGTDHIHLGHHFVRATQDADGVTAELASKGAGTSIEVRGDVLVGADGIHSQLRAQLHPGEGKPRWNGTWLWRGVTHGKRFLSGRSMIMAGHSEHKFVCYPIGPSTRSGEEVLINWVAELRQPVTELTEREDWNKEGKLEEFLPQFESWKFDWLDVPGMIRSAEAVYVYPMVDRDPLEHWGEGRITLLGDAGHPMYPVGSNGASQAILDARVLSGCLRSKQPIPDALRAYEKVRLPATAALTLANRKQGPEECMTLVEARAPNGFERIEDVISEAELQAIAAKYKRLAGFTIDEINQRPSLAHVQY